MQNEILLHTFTPPRIFRFGIFAFGNVKYQTIMCKMEKAYSRFGEMVADGSVLTLKNHSFTAICRLLGVSPASLDEILMEELGMDGEMILYKCEKLLNLQALTNS